MANIFTKIFGSRNDRLIKSLSKKAKHINALESEYQALSDEALKAKTEEFKKRFSDGETLDQLLTEAFAAVREASVRQLQMRHFDVQLIGGMVLHSGKIAEMRTGEGKTLVATLPAYLNALSGGSVHVITVNDYLANRDAKWMEPVYNALGLTVGINVPGINKDQKRAAYEADITYGTNNEFGFDYLRDNMAFRLEDRVQRGRAFAVIDEVDSILIDEARTPLVISGAAEDSSELYKELDKLVPGLNGKVTAEIDDEAEEEADIDYVVEEKSKHVSLTEYGQEHVEELLIKAGLLAEEQSLYSVASIALLHHINAALRAHTLFRKDVDYVVQDQNIVIVDEHTGRTMPGRRWGDGLHQAIEAKERVRIRQENQTLASITFQNYFRLYDKLSGMTGTADTEAFELQQIYGLEVAVIPTNKPMIRNDMGDLIYLTAEEKYRAIIQDIKAASEKGQPCLVGTIAIETSEFLSGVLSKEGIEHKVLNAKFHMQEAEIVALAGKPGAVTIATNMAGRGTDIVLGGNWQVEIAKMEDPTEAQISAIKSQWEIDHDTVIKAGGLYIIGTERHESRRIDNQLRGRSGRQGDPGASRFYLSLEDNLMRIFASDRVAGLMQKLGMEKDEAIEHRWVTRAIENAQRKVEGRNFDIRKQLLDYDNVANDQRKVIYDQRDVLMSGVDQKQIVTKIREDVLNDVVSEYIPMGSLEEQWHVAELEERFRKDFFIDLPVAKWLKDDDELHEESLKRRIVASFADSYEAKEKQVGPEVIRQFEQQMMLQTLDNLWKDHLGAMDYLRQGIHLRGYAQKNPKQEYKREAFQLFTELLNTFKYEVVNVLCRVEIRTQEEVEAAERRRLEQEARQKMHFNHAQAESSLAGASAPEAESGDRPAPPVNKPFKREVKKVGRNEPCPCGSGKKFKQCHGKLVH